MRLAPGLSVCAGIVVLVALSACGSDSTGPKQSGQTAADVAKHFDSLYVSAVAGGDTAGSIRRSGLSDFELAAAFGAVPTTVSVTTAVSSEEWKGYVFEEVSNHQGVPADSGILVLAFRDEDAHTFVASGFAADGSSLGTTLVANDTVQLEATASQGSAELKSVGGNCATPPSGLTNPVISTANMATCASATFTASLAATFPSHAGNDAGLTSISFTTTTFAGERFVDPLNTTVTARQREILLHLLRTNAAR